MTFREQKPAFRVFLGTLYGLAAMGVVFLVLALASGDHATRTAADYAAATHQQAQR